MEKKNLKVTKKLFFWIPASLTQGSVQRMTSLLELPPVMPHGRHVPWKFFFQKKFSVFPLSVTPTGSKFILRNKRKTKKQIIKS